MKFWTPPTNEMIEKVLSSVKKETDRQYFFSRLNNPLWVLPLRERGYFNNPPGMKELPDGYVQFPNWPELTYLVTVAEEATDQVIDIVLTLPKTDNPRIYGDILAIALKLEGQKSAKLLPKLVEYTELGNPFLAHRYPELLAHWTTQGNYGAALEMVKKLIPFQEDPRAQEKQRLYKKNLNTLETLLDPAPRFHEWDYQQILNKGVCPLAEKEPYEVALLLIDAVANMLRLGIHTEDLDKVRGEDYSEIWCRRLDKPDRDHQTAKEMLVQTLAFACERVYEKAPGSIDALDQALRSQRWKVFRRLRQQLYASHLNDQTLPWIRELIIGHVDYAKWEHHYEFQLMIRKACELFGPRLLSEGEQSNIFNAILSGPSKEDFREWMGERYTDEAFKQRQRYFHRMQLRPFVALLSGELRRYLDELDEDADAKDITDGSYSPAGEERGGFVSYRSPKTEEDLENLTDEELLVYLNDWSEERRDKHDWLVEINISALAGVFQSLFKGRIVPDGGRLAFWMAHRDKIARPIYVASMIKVMQELINDKKFEDIDQWIDFCAWVLAHQDSKRVEGQPEPREESRDLPDWGSSRRAVVDFIDVCVNKDINAPATARVGLASLLQQVCNQPDWRLDHDLPVLLNQDDPIAEAINNTRSRALESLVHFGFWIRRHLPEDTVPEVTDILSRRLGEGAEFPLTRPEHALLGMHFGNLCALNQSWAIGQRGAMFPQGNIPVWRDAIGSYIRFNKPFKVMFEILRNDFEFALENLNVLKAAKEDSGELVDRLGQHLFTYYLWQLYSLAGAESLLARFYEKTSGDRRRWARLFDHVGRSLRNSGKQLEKELTDRAIAYFDWRLAAAEPLELQEYTFWLEADCLDAEWRLRSYAKILDFKRGKDVGQSLEVKALNKLLPDHLPLVIECFAKITDTLDQGSHLYILADVAKPILRSGLNADDPEVRAHAERARENLLRLGRFDFLDMT